jgi:alpha-amylase/alpha-mannosidase (GH57 family)
LTRYVCIHGHFYQPPRENPWLEVVERQESARPFHDWNERVHAECYGPNAAARILAKDGVIERIVNNYERISFNFGATLLSWMAQQKPDVHDLVVRADAAARARSGGHGSALAQVYGHLILPLANARDKRTQVRWGLRDFEWRFGRCARGMWLSETACDVETLEVLSDAGVEFTVLAPHQCARVRAPGQSEWIDVSGARVDSRRPYRVVLPSGRAITIFFYDGPASRAVAFERLLDDGGRFARRLMDLLDTRQEPQLVHIATDGETYGHHHRFGEMALAFALAAIEDTPGIELTTYEAFLARHPAEWEAQIEPNTSWSCAHGIERWRADCGCKTGGPPEWNQRWRAPLRQALDELRDALAEVFEREGARHLTDPWAARDAYIELVLDRGEPNVERFFAEHGLARLSADGRVRALELLELQRHAMMMFTSCGWFFDDLGGIETIQVLAYAARAIQLASSFTEAPLEARFLEALEAAESNRAELGNGRRIYLEHVVPARVDLRKVAAHYAASSLFETYAERERLFGFEVHSLERRDLRAGQARLAIGRVRVQSRLTSSSEEFSYAVLHLGDHNLSGGARASSVDPRAHELMRDEIAELFARADITEVLRRIERHFPDQTYSLRTLFRDEQKKILDDVMVSTLEGVERSYASIYDQFAPLMRFLASLGQPVPKALHQAAEYTLTARLKRELDKGRDVDLEAADAVLREARDTGVTLELSELGVAVQRALELMLQALARDPDDLALLEAARVVATVARNARLEFDVSAPQNRFYDLRETLLPERREDPRWLSSFRGLGVQLGVAVA